MRTQNKNIRVKKINRPRSFWRGQKCFGFTLVEVMASMAIMTVVALGSASTLASNKAQSFRSDDNLLAMMVLEKKSAELKREFYKNGSPIPAQPPASPPLTTWTDNRIPQTQVWEMSAPEFKNVSITIVWSLMPDPKPSRAGTLIDRMIKIDLTLRWTDRQNHNRERTITNYLLRP